MPMRVIWILVGFLIFLFISQNLNFVEISLLLGRPVAVPLALVILAAFSLGFLAGLGILARRRRRRQAAFEDGDVDFGP
ncbi:LapA family protein [Rhodovastum atsumiense]|uniref:DUF1049 domain-containing protein n=1 Tax=Rhodovastum atsumiense TaxID=504468 RepID=A0A5M6IP27_9PROT|nr:lipopolysaccharide assembly protein LapA domain-containing protein [Rhodovastum atsumiense]KAA5610001.1 DUF1049 domain-containing protein [Rhodovastum atsumiense]